MLSRASVAGDPGRRDGHQRRELGTVATGAGMVRSGAVDVVAADCGVVE